MIFWNDIWVTSSPVADMLPEASKEPFRSFRPENRAYNRFKEIDRVAAEDCSCPKQAK